MLNQQRLELYSRNILIKEIGEIGQQKLLQSKILVIGAGGLGSSLLQYLACAGIGSLGIIDNDKVELSNLQRQIIHDFSKINFRKVDSAEEKLQKLNPDLNLQTYAIRANYQNLTEIIKDYEIVIDATDNFPTRFVINQVCFEQKKPLVFGAVKGFQGQLSIFKAYEKNQPCYACFNSNIVDEKFELPLNEKGILGAVAGSFGAMQALYAIKEILQIGENICGKILIFDFLKNDFRKSILRKNPHCKICK
jgi:molybdopterin/thiamine biosynthesis adenylyltransferase